MKNRKAALGFIFITILIDIIGLGIIVPVIPGLIKELIHGDISDAAKYGGWLSFAYSITQFLCAPVLGNLSDRYGRRPVLLCSLFGFGIDYLFLALAPTIGWLFIGRIVAGITGSSYTTAAAYISDISEPEKKAQNFGLIGVAFGVGFIIGPVLGGILGDYGVRVPFFAASGLCLLNWLYGFFILPESLSKEHRRPFEWKRANPVGTFKQFAKYPAIMGLVVSLVLIYISAHAVQSTWNFYTIKKFAWNSKWVGYSLGAFGVLIALVQGLLIRWIIPRLGKEKSVHAGLFLYSLGFLLFAFASQGWMMFVFMVPYCLGGIAGPSIQSIISSLVPPTEQGELQGGLTSLMSASAIVGPPLMTNLFAYYTNPSAPVQFPGAPFLLGAFLTLISALFAFRNYKRSV